MASCSGKIGLIVEGGGVRGLYAAGVLDALAGAGITFDGVIGVSAGAIHAASFLSGQAGRSLRFYTKYLRDPRFFSLRSFLQTGDLVDTQFCYHELPERLDPYNYAAFLRQKAHFHVTVSNLATGQAEYPRITDMLGQIDLLRASATLPYVSQPVSWRGRLLLDGGCLDPVPIRAFEAMGYTSNVVVLTKPEGSSGKDWDAVAAPLLYRRYRQFVREFAATARRYPATLAYIRAQEAAGRAFVIRPSEKPAAGRLCKDVRLVEQTHALGRRDAERAMPRLAAWLKEKRQAPD